MGQPKRPEMFGPRRRQKLAAEARRRSAVAAVSLRWNGLKAGDPVAWGDNGSHQGLVTEIDATGMCTVTETAVVGRRWHLPAASLRRR